GDRLHRRSQLAQDRQVVEARLRPSRSWRRAQARSAGMSEQNGGSAQPLSGGSGEGAPAPVATVPTVDPNPVVPVPVKQEHSYRSRFTLIYVALVLILA